MLFHERTATCPRLAAGGFTAMANGRAYVHAAAVHLDKNLIGQESCRIGSLTERGRACLPQLVMRCRRNRTEHNDSVTRLSSPGLATWSDFYQRDALLARY